MNKMFKAGVVMIALIMISGCASVGSVANHYVNHTKKEGILYGANVSLKNEINEVCDAIKNKDERCLDRDKYQTVAVMARFGYADAFTGTIALAPKDMDVGEKPTPSLNGFKEVKTYTYLKAKVEKNKLGTILDIASRPGDGKCYWGGMPRTGSTVCPAYNYDASRDFNGMPR